MKKERLKKINNFHEILENNRFFIREEQSLDFGDEENVELTRMKSRNDSYGFGATLTIIPFSAF